MSWVLKDDERFYLHENETVLAGLLRAGYAANFECRQGYCGACKMRVVQISGDRAHTLAPLCRLEDDEILACCCVVRGCVRVV